MSGPVLGSSEGVAAALNTMSPEAARAALIRCCGASAWVAQMLARRPYSSDAEVDAAAAQSWETMARDDLLEAFSHHPKIGASLEQLRKKFADTASLSAAEQAGAAGASEQVLTDLQAGNLRYEARFGFIFIVCATGKTAAQMLALLEARIDNPPVLELQLAAAEQAKITRLRLAQLGAAPAT